MEFDNDFEEPEGLEELEEKLDNCLELSKLDKIKVAATLIKLVSVTLRVIEGLGELGTEITIETLARYTHDGEYNEGKVPGVSESAVSLEKHKEIFTIMFPDLLENIGLIKKYDDTYKVTQKGYAHIFAQMAVQTSVKVLVKKVSGPDMLWKDVDLSNLM